MIWWCFSLGEALICSSIAHRCTWKSGWIDNKRREQQADYVKLAIVTSKWEKKITILSDVYLSDNYSQSIYLPLFDEHLAHYCLAPHQ